MAKNKLSRYRDLNSFPQVIQPSFHEVYKQNFILKGNWSSKFFNNTNPLILELGCGKGEYTLGMAKSFPDKNFIGIDIKGARIWKGARQIMDEQIKNAVFLRTQIDQSEFFFQKNEVSEIWITFPDPQIKRKKKRLTSPSFLNKYRKFLIPEGCIHLKTDSLELYNYTLQLLEFNNCEIVRKTNDLYASSFADDFLSIKTYYESQFLSIGKAITYIQFRLPEKNIENVQE